MRPVIEYGEVMPVERLALANTRERGTYHRPMTEGERATLNESMAQAQVTIEDREAELKATAKMLRDDIKAKKAELARFTRMRRTGRIEVETVKHIFLDHEAGKVHTYNELGERTEVRRMNADEAQLQIPA
jgi:O6-methylguanine-DNA--protein-cysteine methyltransferase